MDNANTRETFIFSLDESNHESSLCFHDSVQVQEGLVINIRKPNMSTLYINECTHNIYYFNIDPGQKVTFLKCRCNSCNPAHKKKVGRKQRKSYTRNSEGFRRIIVICFQCTRFRRLLQFMLSVMQSEIRYNCSDDNE